MHVQQQAAWALGRIGPAAGCAVETLAAKSQDGNARLARLAERAFAASKKWPPIRLSLSW